MRITPDAQAFAQEKAEANLRAARPHRSPVVVLRATFAAPRCEGSDVARWAQVNAPFHAVADGSITPGFGFGAWGVEPCVTLESATPNVEGFHGIVRAALAALQQECAYITVNGRDAYELSVDGRVTAITGAP